MKQMSKHLYFKIHRKDKNYTLWWGINAPKCILYRSITFLYILYLQTNFYVKAYVLVMLMGNNKAEKIAHTMFDHSIRYFGRESKFFEIFMPYQKVIDKNVGSKLGNL